MSRAMISIGDCAAADCLRDHDNAASIGDNAALICNNSAESAMMPQGSLLLTYRCESDPMQNSVQNGDWSNTVPGRQIAKDRIGQWGGSVQALEFLIIYIFKGFQNNLF